MPTVLHLLRWTIPLWLAQFVTNWLPDSRFTQRLRGMAVRPFVRGTRRRLQVGRDVTLLGTHALHIGDDVYIAKGSWVNAGGGLDIEDEVMLGPYVVVSTSRHLFKEGSARFAGWEFGPVRIGRGSWIAAHSTVTSGVTIGRSCAVAANAVVTTDLPDSVLAGGVPARVIRGQLDEASGKGSS